MTDTQKWLLFGGILLIVAVLLFLPIIPGRAQAQVPSITLDWTAPADDDADASSGPATSYQMRWSSTRPDTTSQAAMDSWWATATAVASLPTPAVLGTAQSVTVPGPFPSGRTYYFVMKACDEVPNCSVYSNVAAKVVPDTLPPSRIVDLRVR